MNKHDLYTLCAQNPARDARALLALYGTPPRRAPILGEDFSAAAALSRAWCDAVPGARAVAVDHDRAVLAHAPRHPRVRPICADVLKVRVKADVIAVLNFSICELHQRRTLVRYLRHARSRLRSGGCFVCDIYGGSDAFVTGIISQRVKGPKGERITYQWEQRTADPITGRVTNAMHFRVAPATRARSSKSNRGRTLELHDAFVYDWRLWSLPELIEAMREAGFKDVNVYPRVADAVDQEGNLYFAPIRDAFELGDSFNVFVAARSSS